jgi:hypothetical protein
MINAADVHIYWLTSVAVSQKYLTTKMGLYFFANFIFYMYILGATMVVIAW